MKNEFCWFRRPRKYINPTPQNPRGHWQEKGDWELGAFFQFAQDHLEYESGPGLYPVAIVSDCKTGRVIVVHASDISFSPFNKKPEEED